MTTWQNDPKNETLLSQYFLLIDSVHFLLIDDADHLLLIQDADTAIGWQNDTKH